MPGRRSKPKPYIAAGEVLMWTLFVVLLFPAGLIGWAVGHDTSKHGTTKTVTVTTTSASASPTTTAKAAPTTTASAAPAPAAGKAVFISAGCGACHTFKAAGTSAKVGPDLDTAPAGDAKKAGMPLAAFVKQSIIDPNAYISPGFPKGIMPATFGTTLSAAKIDSLVAFITGK